MPWFDASKSVLERGWRICLAEDMCRRSFRSGLGRARRSFPNKKSSPIRARQSFPKKNEQDFSPEIVEKNSQKNPVKMEKNLDVTYILCMAGTSCPMDLFVATHFSIILLVEAWKSMM
jgi:hypothetical protein